MERYWLSSSGVAIVVDPSVSLFVLKNQSYLSFLSNNTQWPYNPKFSGDLKYDICQIEKLSNSTVFLNQLHLYMINKYFSKPLATPDELMFARPIWSTWAYYKKLIDESKLKEYANAIISNNFTNSQLEIDDKWQTAYGDFSFETIKFPNISRLITELNVMGFRTTLWVHPFADSFSKNYRVYSEYMLAVSDIESSTLMI